MVVDGALRFFVRYRRLLRENLRQKTVGLFFVLLLATLDSVIKQGVHYVLAATAHQTVSLIPGLALVSTWNTGVSFGMLATVEHTCLLWCVGILVCMMVGLLLLQEQRDSLLALVLMIGGALGNLVDRFLHGAVYDFIDCSVKFSGTAYHWPAFNFADICVTLGVLCFLRGGRVSERQEVPSRVS